MDGHVPVTPKVLDSFRVPPLAVKFAISEPHYLSHCVHNRMKYQVEGDDPDYVIGQLQKSSERRINELNWTELNWTEGESIDRSHDQSMRTRGVTASFNSLSAIRDQSESRRGTTELAIIGSNHCCANASSSWVRNSWNKIFTQINANIAYTFISFSALTISKIRFAKNVFRIQGVRG